MKSKRAWGNVCRSTMVMMAASLWFATVAAGDEPAYLEPPVELNAALVVPDGMMVGKGYKIDAVALNDGYSNTYTLYTDVGEVKVVSDYQLRRQIQEIRALIILDEMSRAGVFGDAIKNGLLAPLRAGKALVTEPVETIKGAVKGVGRWMGNIGRAVKSSDPYQEGGVSAAVGWAGTKRVFALELGVDPYTPWEPLQQSLTSVARAAFAGGVTLGVARGAVTDGTTIGTVVEVVSLTGEMNAVLQDNPPEGLTRINREKLLAMGIPAKIADPFLKNYNYTPMEKCLLVESLRRLEGAQGRDLFIAEATAAPDREMARYMQQRAEMMANYHTKTTAADIVKIGNSILQINRKGVLVGIYPFDYLVWTENTARIAAAVAKNAQARKREIWLEGTASPASLAALTAGGWKVKERVGLLTGQALQDQSAAGAGAGAVGAAVKRVVP